MQTQDWDNEVFVEYIHTGQCYALRPLPYRVWKVLKPDRFSHKTLSDKRETATFIGKKRLRQAVILTEDSRRRRNEEATVF